MKALIMTILLSITFLSTANALPSFNMFPSLDFDMAQNAILRSKAIQEVEDDIEREVAQIERINRKDYKVTFKGGCFLVARFGKRSQVEIVEDTFICL